MNALTRLFVWLLTMFYRRILKPLYRFLVHWSTGKTELERLSDRAFKSANDDIATCDVLIELEEFLKDSTDPKFEEVLACRDQARVSEFSRYLVERAKIKPASKSNRVRSSLESLLPYLLSYNDLVAKVELTRLTPYDSTNGKHEAELTGLWKHLRPEQELTSRVSNDWTDIGFQGDDPKTDFRGMGMLGLRNLSYYASQEGESARRTVLRSHHPQYWYSWAIVGINLTSLCLEFLKKGLFKRTIYVKAAGTTETEAKATSSTTDALFSSSSSPSSSVKGRVCALDHFHDIFCNVFSAFDEYWFRREKSIMQFNSVREEFRLSFLHRLRLREDVKEALGKINLS